MSVWGQLMLSFHLKVPFLCNFVIKDDACFSKTVFVTFEIYENNKLKEKKLSKILLFGIILNTGKLFQITLINIMICQTTFVYDV